MNSHQRRKERRKLARNGVHHAYFKDGAGCWKKVETYIRELPEHPTNVMLEKKADQLATIAKSYTDLPLAIRLFANQNAGILDRLIERLKR